MKTLQEAIAERDAYLEEHPGLKPMQKEIDEVLSKTPEKMRLEVLNTLMLQKMLQTADILNRLTKIIDGES